LAFAQFNAVLILPAETGDEAHAALNKKQPLTSCEILAEVRRRSHPNTVNRTHAYNYHFTALAPVSNPIQSSPQEERSSSPEDSSSEEEDETLVLDNEPLPERPRLSLPIDIDSGTSENSSPDMPPPRLSLQFDEEDLTTRSVEYPRRAISEQDRQRLGRMSFGDVRMSENFGDLTRLDAFSEHGDTTMLPQDDVGDIEQSQLDEAAFDAG
jgi:hypothetical protein